MSVSPNLSDSETETSENGSILINNSDYSYQLDLNSSSHLENLFSNISISGNIETMAPPNFDTKLLEIVPKFDGNPLELASFLEISQKLITTYWNSEDINCVQNLAIIYGIYAKIIGKAREVYSICVSKDWKTVKEALIAHFGDQRNENGLLFDLDQLRQYANEPPMQYHTRVMSNLSALHNYIDTHNDPTSIVKKSFYNLHALTIFLAGLKEPLGSTIRSMKPKDLAEARQYIISESNIRHLQKPQYENSANKSKHQNQSKQNFHQNNFPRFHNFNTYQQNYTPQQMFQPPANTFPRAPININPRPMPPQKFFTNQQVFGPPRNVWKPNPQAAQNLPKPVPMSGISHGTNRFSNKNFQLHNVENANYYPSPFYAENYNYYPDYQDYGNVSYDTNNYSMQNEHYDPQELYNEQCTSQSEINQPEVDNQTPIEQNFHEAEPPAEMP